MDLQKRKQQLQEEYQKAIQVINQGVKARDRIEGALSLIDEMEKKKVVEETKPKPKTSNRKR